MKVKKRVTYTEYKKTVHRLGVEKRVTCNDSKNTRIYIASENTKNIHVE